MPSIGDYSFLSGDMPLVLPAMMDLATREREGISGHEFAEIGNRAPIVQWRTEVDVVGLSGGDPLAGVQALIAAYRAMSGALQTVVNVDGSSVSGVATKLLAVEAKKVLSPLGGLAGGDWFVIAHWRLQAGL
jgi:hypothetical protein